MWWILIASWGLSTSWPERSYPRTPQPDWWQEVSRRLTVPTDDAWVLHDLQFCFQQCLPHGDLNSSFMGCLCTSCKRSLNPLSRSQGQPQQVSPTLEEEMVFQVHGGGLLKSARRGVRRSQGVFFSAHWGVSPADMLLEFTVAALASQGGSPKWQGEPMTQREGLGSTSVVKVMLTIQVPLCTASCKFFSRPEIYILRVPGWHVPGRQKAKVSSQSCESQNSHGPAFILTAQCRQKTAWVSRTQSHCLAPGKACLEIEAWPIQGQASCPTGERDRRMSMTRHSLSGRWFQNLNRLSKSMIDNIMTRIKETSSLLLLGWTLPDTYLQD